MATVHTAGTNAASDAFADRLLVWFDHHGRKDLPWQRSRDPYPIWVSEIMLQQTQVATVVPYFEKFMAHFPDMVALADAPVDAVLQLWSGLGYYARARNLHRAATLMRDQHGGKMPTDFDDLLDLPGIGRATAGAILAQSKGLRFPILDGNVKRVLARYHAEPGWPGETAVARRLWSLAERHTPRRRVADYTQAIMDLGALVCVRTKPRCAQCPQQSGCQAHQQGDVHNYPEKKPKRARPLRRTVMLVITRQDGAVLLQKRPPAGIWGGLWSLPSPGDDAMPIEQWCHRRLGFDVEISHRDSTLRHGFTHFELEIEPVYVRLRGDSDAVMDSEEYLWYNSRSAELPGVPAPVKRLLRNLACAWKSAPDSYQTRLQQ